MTQEKHKHAFQTEVKQLLHLVIHSLYSNKEVFLRELVSNSSDALDKLRFLALSNASLYEEDSDLKIEVRVDKEKRLISIKDNGIGMNEEDIIQNLGTIAKSGTKEFISHLTGDEAKDSHLIGQFGVGFYSAFIIADKVVVKSRKAGEKKEEGVMWTSCGEGDFTLESISVPKRGTEVILHVKENEDDFLTDWKLQSIISKYSNHICWPILMEKTLTDEEKKESKTEVTMETVNKATALWTLQKSEIKEEEYKELYKDLSHDFEDPLLWAHNHVEGKQDYISLLYIPSKAPFDLFQQESKHGLKLYIKRVFVMDDADQVLPKYLRFVKGIIDSNDLPLNVSREILQDNKLIHNIKSASVKRILSQLEKLTKNDEEKYQLFWNNFGQVLKEGVVEDFANKEKIAKLLRFSTTDPSSTETQDISLDTYVSRMDKEQDKIYYITAQSYNAAKNSPHLEYFRKKGIEVLLLVDRVDEWLVSHLNEFNGKNLQSITKGKLDLPEETDKKKEKEDKKNYASMIKQIKEILGSKVKDVEITYRLTDSPACIVADQDDMGLEMQRIMQAAGQSTPESKPIFEINPSHHLIQKLNDETDDNIFAQWTKVLFEQSILSEGGSLEDPAAFVNNLNRLLGNLAK
jgi:molecular chaperone HtpG